MEFQRRPSSRLLLVDSTKRVLLFHFTLPNRTFWATPGGGLNDGENFEQAARRELWEETGHVVQDAGPQVGAREFPMQLPDGSYVVTDERFFLLRVHSDAVSRQGWTPSENRFISDLRWWTLNELSTTSETVFPQDLLDILFKAGVV